jgi:hypothetical protein
MSNAGWFAVPLIVLVGLAYLWVVSRLVRQQPKSQEGKWASHPPMLTFSELYALFGVGPFSREEWPVLQSSANDREDQRLARLKARRRGGQVPGK